MSKPIRALIIEDSEEDAELMAAELQLGGYDLIYERVDTADLMSVSLSSQPWDVILCDYSMPHFNAPDALRVLREKGIDLPFIIVSGAVGEATAVAAMKDGAHDYIMKGSLTRLGAAIERELRDAEVRRERRRAEERVRLQQRRLAVLHDINLATTSTLNLRSVLDILLEKVAVLFPASASFVRLVNQETGELEVAASRNLEGQECADLHHWTRGLHQGDSRLVVRNLEQPSQIGPLDGEMPRGFNSYVSIPLISKKDDFLGTLSFLGREEPRLGDDEAEFLSTLGGQVSMAIHNAQLYEQTSRQTHDLRLANEQLREQAAELERASRLKSEFLGVMSHELRTPLAVVLSYSEMMQEGYFGALNAKQKQALEKILTRSHDLLKMINGILDVTRIESGNTEKQERKTRLTDFMKDLQSDYLARKDEHVQLLWEYLADSPEIKMDCPKVKQVVLNLIDNGLKFTHQGNVVVEARLSSVDHKMEFEVRDTGIGIGAGDRKAIFDMFHQVDSSNTRAYGGTGIGLFVVKKFTEILGGSVEVESELGKGSTFKVKIPYSPVRPSEE